MKYPALYEIEQTRDVIEVFKGLNRNLRIEDGEFSDLNNLSSDRFPVLSVREKRALLSMSGVRDFVHIDGDIWWSDGTDLHLNNDETPVMEGFGDELTTFGAYILSKSGNYINTANTSDAGSIDVENSAAEASVKVYPCTENGTDITTTVSSTAPTEPTNGDYWLDISGDNETPVLKQWSENAAMWVTVPIVYTCIEAEGIGNGLSQYDGVDIEITKTVTETISVPVVSGSYILWGVSANQIIITGSGISWQVYTGAISDSEGKFTGEYTINRSRPEMDYWFESGNRMWGCKYGAATNEIYASKLGDFKNWNCFMGISTDSYAVSVGSAGPFTGGISHLGYPLFFKNDRVYKLYGSAPSEYQVKETPLHGIAAGASKTASIVGQTLFYKGDDGIYTYDGSTASKISYALGDDLQLTDPCGGTMGHKYVIAGYPLFDMQAGEDPETFLYFYDTETGIWHREYAAPRVTRIASVGNGMLFLEDYTEQRIWHAGLSSYTVKWGNETEETEPVSWYSVTAPMGLGMIDRKYISRVLVRLRLDSGSNVKFFIQYDSKGPWEIIEAVYASLLRTVNIPLRPHRCDHFRLRIEGTGAAEIYAIVKTIEQGSDI